MLNTINNPGQTDTKRGEVTLPAASGMPSTNIQNLLAKIVTNTVAQFSLPAAQGDLAFWAISQSVNGNVSAEVPSLNENCRLYAYGTGNAGDILILADPVANSGAQAGMVRSTVGSHAPSSGTYNRIGIAEEIFVDGQLVKTRMIPGSVTV